MRAGEVARSQAARCDAPMCSFVRKLGHAKTQAALIVINPT
jgi:hypothetical protein